MYNIYILDNQDKLMGICDIKELLQAEPEDVLEKIMTTHVISLTPESTLMAASKLFMRYLFRAIPIVDEEEKMLGVVPYRDVM